MSRIGRKKIQILEGVSLKTESIGGGLTVVTVTGPLGELKLKVEKGISVKIENGFVRLDRESDTKRLKSFHGLYRSLIKNMIDGVKDGFEKKLVIVGIGYKAEAQGEDLKITLGATHPYLIKAPEGIKFSIEDKVNILIKGIDKQLVGQIAAKIRDFGKPEPYKGKGIRYENEYVRIKPGKAAKSTTETP